MRKHETEATKPNSVSLSIMLSFMPFLMNNTMISDINLNELSLCSMSSRYRINSTMQ